MSVKVGREARLPHIEYHSLGHLHTLCEYVRVRVRVRVRV
jgi:hypothetical protein